MVGKIEQTWGLAICLLALVLGIGLVRSRDAWASPAAKPHRQTVPMTPPPTWTPVPGPSQATTTREPRSAPRPATPVAGALPWLDLDSDSFVVGPGSEVLLALVLENLGGASLSGATISLTVPPWLVPERIEAEGQTSVSGFVVTWLPPQIEPGAREQATIRGSVTDLVPPDTQTVLQASVAWTGGVSDGNEITLSVPWLLLPDTGDSQ